MEEPEPTGKEFFRFEFSMWIAALRVPLVWSLIDVLVGEGKPGNRRWQLLASSKSFIPQG